MRKEELTRGIYQATKVAKALHGAAFGTPAAESFPLVLSPNLTPQEFPPNPNVEELINHIPNLINRYPLSNFETPLIWSPRQLDLVRLFSTIISHSDDHSAKIAREFFPVDLCLSYISAIKDTSKKVNHPLNIIEQFDIALELAKGSIFSAVVLAHSSSRAISRNKDQRVNDKLIFTPNDMSEWGQSIARFKSSDKYDPPGDTYHFWAMCAMSIAIENRQAKKAFTKEQISFLFQHGSDVMSLIRSTLARNPLHFKHREIDEQGFQLGYYLANLNKETTNIPFLIDTHRMVKS